MTSWIHVERVATHRERRTPSEVRFCWTRDGQHNTSNVNQMRAARERASAARVSAASEHTPDALVSMFGTRQPPLSSGSFRLPAHNSGNSRLNLRCMSSALPTRDSTAAAGSALDSTIPVTRLLRPQPYFRRLGLSMLSCSVRSYTPDSAAPGYADPGSGAAQRIVNRSVRDDQRSNSTRYPFYATDICHSYN